MGTRDKIHWPVKDVIEVEEGWDTLAQLTNVAKEIYRLAIRDRDGNDDISTIFQFSAQNRDAQLGSV
jgi:hypothetical protein